MELHYTTSAYKPTHKLQFLQLLWRRANAWNISLLSLYGGQFMFSTYILVNTELPAKKKVEFGALNHITI